MAELIQDAQIKELVNTSARSCLIRKNHVFLPFVFIGQPEEKRMLRASRRQLTLLHFYGRNGCTLEEAADKAGLQVSSAVSFLKRRDVQDWLKNLSEEAAIKYHYDRPEWWYKRAHEMDAMEEVPNHRLEIWRQIGDRVCPRARTEHETIKTETKIEIKIDPKRVEEALRDRDSITTTAA